MDKQHNWDLTVIAEGEEAALSIDGDASALRDKWFKIGRAYLAARRQYASNQAFGEWVKASPLARFTDDERSCAMRLAEHEQFARVALEGTTDTSVRTMLERIKKLLHLMPSSQRCEDEPESILEPAGAVIPAENAEINEAGSPEGQNPAGIQITPRPAPRAQDLEKTIGPEDAAYIRGWFTKNLPDGKRPLYSGVASVDECKPILAAIAVAVKSGECVHADVASLDKFDIRMAFPHVPKALALSIGKVSSWPKLNAKKKSGKSDWERFAELNELCKVRSVYAVEKKAPNGVYRLREQKHEDEIAHCARQWWHSGHWPGDTPPLQVLAGGKPAAAAPAPAGGAAAIYYGMQLWPLDPDAWRKPDDPLVPTKNDVDNTYWFVEELHRVLVSRGIEHRIAAKFIRNWSKYIGALQKPAAAASVMQDMAQGLDTFAMNPESGLDLKNRMPSRPTKFAAEG